MMVIALSTLSKWLLFGIAVCFVLMLIMLIVDTAMGNFQAQPRQKAVKAAADTAAATKKLDSVSELQKVLHSEEPVKAEESKPAEDDFEIFDI